MRRLSLTLALAVATLPAALTHAQPGPTPPAASNEVRARAFGKEGVRLSKLGQHTDALALFIEAYALFPNGAILFNIAETQRALGLHLEAAASYQRIVDDPTQPADLVARAQIGIVEAERSLTRVTLEVATTDASPVEISIDNAAWIPLPANRLVRVVPGIRVIRARGGGVPITAEATIEAVAGISLSVPLRLVVDPPPPIELEPPSDVAPAPPPVHEPVASTPVAPPAIEAPGPSRAPGRFGGFVHAAVSSQLDGVTGVLGATFAPHPRVTLALGAMLGGNNAGFATATYAILPGKLRPTVTAGAILARHEYSLASGTGMAPLYIGTPDTLYPGVHGAVGGEWILSRRMSAIADVAVDYYPTGAPYVVELEITPTLGVHARL